MQITERNLVYLIEECSEVIHAASKILRFGSADFDHHTNFENAATLTQEICQLQAVIELFDIDEEIMNRLADDKHEKLDYYKPLERLQDEEV